MKKIFYIWHNIPFFFTQSYQRCLILWVKLIFLWIFNASSYCYCAFPIFSICQMVELNDIQLFTVYWSLLLRLDECLNMKLKVTEKCLSEQWIVLQLLLRFEGVSIKIGVFSNEGQHLLHIFADRLLCTDVHVWMCLSALSTSVLFYPWSQKWTSAPSAKNRITAEFLRLNPETNFLKI